LNYHQAILVYSLFFSKSNLHSMRNFVFLMIICAFFSCSKGDSGNTPVVPAVTTPTIASFSPLSATTGAVVTITGTNFTGATAITFGGTAATAFTVVSASSITASVGTGTSGDIKVTTASGTATLAGFTFISPYAACKLPEFLVRGDVGIGFPRISVRTPSTGTVKVTVIFVDFSDAPATRTPQDVFATISPAAENYYNAVSYTNMALSFDPSYKWFRMSKPSSGYGWAALTFDLQKAYIQEAITLADPTVDFSKSDAFLIVSNPDGGSLTNGPAFTATGTNGITVDGKLFNNGATSGKDLLVYKGLWFPHEFGHTMSLVDLYAFTGDTHRFVGDFSIMGNILGTAPEMTAWERWILGWISDTQVSCFSNTGSSTMTLTPIESKSGMKMLVIPIDGNSAVVVESRKPLGYDNLLTKSGPLVYVVDTKIATGTGTFKVLPINDADLKKLQAPLTVGQTLIYNNITIKFVSTDASGDVIQYEKK
jgi:M6 family metalloprotease-like protein